MADMDPPWLFFARQELGQREIPGALNNPRIVEYHTATSGGDASDEIPWCASFVCWVLTKRSVPNPRSKSSQAFRMWGMKTEPAVGAIGVITGRDGKGHVGFVVGKTVDGRIAMLGGNQSNQVCIKAFLPEKFSSFRWPALPVIDDPGLAGSTR